MIENQIYSKLFFLQSPELKQDVLNYLEDMINKQFFREKPKKKRAPQFGCAKGKFRMADDFDAPIDHFDEYMPE